jgi:hypothetical protein
MKLHHCPADGNTTSNDRNVTAFSLICFLLTAICTEGVLTVRSQGHLLKVTQVESRS